MDFRQGALIVSFLLHTKAAVMGLVEGLTEFLPVSSTGHLIVAGSVLHFDIPSRAVFIVAIQAAAILAVCWEYRVRLRRMVLGLWKDGVDRRLAFNIGIAFLPAAVLGVLFKSVIEKVLFGSVPVACAFFMGGLVILWVERRIVAGEVPVRLNSIDEVRAKDALKIGLAQCFALIPGVSRSGATIVGSLLIGVSRKTAAEFSFFLAIPTVVGACVYSLFKARHDLGIAADAPLYLTASVAAFLSAFACVRWFLKYIGGHDFRAFAWYRMAFGVIIFLTGALGLLDWS
jgi:undecaprenyl-diphosphatase